MNSIDANNCTNGCANLYGDTYDDNTEMSNYKWYNDNKNLDKIGISPDGSQLTHDSMLYRLKKFKKIEKIINNVNTIQLTYKLDNKTEVVDTSSTKYQYFTDLIFSEQSNYITFKYIEFEGKMIFSHIIFNGKMFS